ncbi:MAG: hypothetical protein ABI685_10665 [Ferruginibacter sp.]
MSKYLKTTGIFFGVWFIAALLNGLLSGISIAVLDSYSISDAMANLFSSFVCSFVFSVPLVGLVWFVTIMAQLADKKGDPLFQLVLSTAFLCSIAGAVLFIYGFRMQFANARYVVGLGIIISALTAVLFFRKQIKKNA